MIFKVWWRSRIKKLSWQEARPELSTWKRGELITFSDDGVMSNTLSFCCINENKIILKSNGRGGWLKDQLAEINLWDDSYNRSQVINRNEEKYQALQNEIKSRLGPQCG